MPEYSGFEQKKETIKHHTLGLADYAVLEAFKRYYY